MSRSAALPLPSEQASSTLRALVVVTFFIYFGWGVIAPVLPLFGRDLGASEPAIGVLVAAFASASFCFDITGGQISDRLGARRTAVSGAVLVAAASVLGGLAPNYWVLLLSRLLSGVGSAFYVTTAMNIIARTTAQDRMGRSMSAYQGAILSGVALGPAVGGFMTQYIGVRAPFLVAGSLVAVCTVVAWRTLPVRLPVPEHIAGERPPFSRLLRNGAYLTALAVAFVVFVIRSGVTSTSVPLFATEDLGLSRGMVGVALTVSAASNLLWLPHAGKLADQRHRRVTVVVGLLAALAGLALLAVSSGVVLLLVAMFVLGIATAYAGVTPAAIITDVAPPAQSGMALGTYRMAIDGASVAAPVSAGIIADLSGFHGVVLAFMLPLALVLLVSLRLRDTRRVTDTAPLVTAPARER
jgi:MFS family permease